MQYIVTCIIHECIFIYIYNINIHLEVQTRHNYIDPFALFPYPEPPRPDWQLPQLSPDVSRQLGHLKVLAVHAGAAHPKAQSSFWGESGDTSDLNLVFRTAWRDSQQNTCSNIFGWCCLTPLPVYPATQLSTSAPCIHEAHLPDVTSLDIMSRVGKTIFQLLRGALKHTSTCRWSFNFNCENSKTSRLQKKPSKSGLSSLCIRRVLQRAVLTQSHKMATSSACFQFQYVVQSCPNCERSYSPRSSPKR